MRDKSYFDNQNNSYSNHEEFKDQPIKYNLSKFDSDLYREEDDVCLKSVRIKRFTSPNKEEKWKIFEDTKMLFVLEGSKLTKKEKEFLRTVDGLNFLLNKYKDGSITTLSSAKKQIKDKISKK